MSLPFDIAEVAQPVPQSLQRWPGLIRENADFPKLARRLRSDGSWPRSRRAAEQRDEVAASQLVKWHSVPHQPGPDYRISNSQASGRGYCCIFSPRFSLPAPLRRTTVHSKLPPSRSVATASHRRSEAKKGSSRMSMSCKFERSLLSHEEHETIWVTHHPAIYEHDVEGLQTLRV